MTDQELQSLRNLGNECEAAADEIVRLRANLQATESIAAKMQAHAAQELAAERERWTTPVRALLISHDEGLRLLGEMMRARGVASVTLPIDTREGFDAIEVLRGLVEGEQR